MRSTYYNTNIAAHAQSILSKLCKQIRRMRYTVFKKLAQLQQVKFDLHLFSYKLDTDYVEVEGSKTPYV